MTALQPYPAVREDQPVRHPQTFHLQRDEDVTGVSGPGKVAEGVVFTDGRVAVRWIVGDHRSTVAWDSIDDVAAINGHEGRTRIVWHDDRTGHFLPDYVPPGPA